MKAKQSYAGQGELLHSELTQNIEAQDLVKAEIVLAHLGEVEASWRKKMVVALQSADPDWVLRLLVRHFRKEPEHRSHFEEYGELVWDMVENHPELLKKHVNETFRPFIVEALRREAREKLILNAMELCEWVHDEEIVPLVADYLYSGKRVFVTTSVKALGAMGLPRGYEALTERMGTDREIDHLVLDVIAQNPQPGGMAILIQTVMAPEAAIRNHAKNLLTRLGKTAVPFLCDALSKPDKDLQIHILNVLGLIEDGHAVDPIRDLLLHGAEDANVRFAAYEALGSLPLKTKSYALAVGLSDEDEQVRFAAARAINKNLSPSLERGLFNMVKPHNKEVVHLIEVFLNSESDRIFLTLLKEEFFKEQATLYLVEKAHPELREHYAQLLRRYGETEMAEIISPSAKEEKQAADIWAVDDSRMVLKIYRKQLHKLDRETELFEFPSRALEKIESERPKLIFVDLNMPEMNGLDFARKVREHYNSKELPIILVTTQTETQDQSEVKAAGINQVLSKPFTEEDLAGAMKRWL